MQTSSRYPWGRGTPRVYRLASTDDSDVSLTVPTGKIWAIKHIYFQLTASGDAGNRVLGMVVTDGTNNVFQGVKSGNIAATQKGAWSFGCFSSAAGTTASWLPLLDGTTANIVVYGQFAAEMILLAGYVLRLWDTAAIAPAADDMIIVVHYTEYDA